MTKTLLVLLCLGVATRARADAPRPDLCAASADRAAIDSVVFIRADGGGGTGFLVRDGTHVATALHVLQHQDVVVVVTRDRRHFPAHVVAVDEPHDLAIVEVSESLGAPLALASAAPYRSQPVAIIGHAGVSDLDAPKSRWAAVGAWALTAGTISQVSDDTILTDAGSIHGNSGGPVLDCEGRVLGVVQMKLIGDSHTGATRSALLAALLERIGRDRSTPGIRGGVQLQGGLASLTRKHTDSVALDISVRIDLEDWVLRLGYQTGPAWPDAANERVVATKGSATRWSLQAGSSTTLFSRLEGGLQGDLVYADWESEQVSVSGPDATVHRDEQDESFVAVTGSLFLRLSWLTVTLGVDLGWPTHTPDVTLWASFTLLRI